MKFVSETNGLELDEIRVLFPDAKRSVEVVMFMPKSMLVVKANA